MIWAWIWLACGPKQASYEVTEMVEVPAMAIDRWPLLAHSLVELVYLSLGALFAW